MKVNILSTGKTCGIGVTNQYTINGMKPSLKQSKVKLNQIIIDKPFSKNPFYFMGLALKSVKKCDVVHVHYNHDCFGKFLGFYGFQNFFVYLILILSFKPIVTTFHEYTPYKGKGIKRILYHILNYLPLHASHAVVVTTRRARKQLIKYESVPARNIWIIPLSSFSSVKKVRYDIAKQKLDLKDKYVLTQFGFIDTNKGHEYVIKALTRLPDKYHFLIAGDSRSEKGKKYKEKLIDLVNKYNLHERVTFYGFVKKKDFGTIMAASNVLIYPYTDITSSLALTTGLSYYRPTITSDITPFKDFNKQYKCTVMFKSGNVSDLVLKIKNLVHNWVYRKSKVNSIKNFVNTCNWETAGLKQIVVYHWVSWK